MLGWLPRWKGDVGDGRRLPGPHPIHPYRSLDTLQPLPPSRRATWQGPGM